MVHRLLNWTFGGQCGIGARGRGAPPPYMADQYGPYPLGTVLVAAQPLLNPVEQAQPELLQI